MKRIFIVLPLCSVCIIFCIDDQSLFVFRQHYICLHDRKHITEIIIKLPRDLRGISSQLRMLFSIVFQNEFLIQTVHSLFIKEIHQLRCTIGLSLQQTLKNEIADGNQHTVCLIITVILYVPVH